MSASFVSCANDTESWCSCCFILFSVGTLNKGRNEMGEVAPACQGEPTCVHVLSAVGEQSPGRARAW